MQHPDFCRIGIVHPLDTLLGTSCWYPLCFHSNVLCCGSRVMFEKPVCEELFDTERRPAGSRMVHRGHIRVDVASTQVGCGDETRRRSSALMQVNSDLPSERCSRKSDIFPSSVVCLESTLDLNAHWSPGSIKILNLSANTTPHTHIANLSHGLRNPHHSVLLHFL